MKECTKCLNIKNVDCFHIKSDSKDGLHPFCKKCRKQQKKEYYLTNKEKILLKNKKWFNDNPDKTKNIKNKWLLKNQQKRKEIVKKYKTSFKAKSSELIRKNKNSNYKISCNLRSRLWNSIKANKTGSAIKDLGCSVEELKKHLESKFQPGMTWENYGRNGWHIDHIKPLSSFDLMNREEFLKACNYNNLQPLWAIDNLKKGSK